MKNIKENGSVTVTMSLVLFTVISLILVMLEHDYAAAGRTLAFCGFNKALESVMGAYYAPLYTDYGLLAVPVADGFEYESALEIEAAVKSGFDAMFGNGSLFSSELHDVKLQGAVTLASDRGRVFLDQIKEASLYDGALAISAGLIEMAEEDSADLDEILKKLNGELDENLSDEEDEEIGDEGAKEVFSKLKKFFTRAFENNTFSP